MADDTNIPTETYVRLPEPYPNLTATITLVEKFNSDKHDAKGYRIELVDVNGVKYSTALWLREKLSEQSKLGCFIKTLGKDYSKWIGQRLLFVEWRDKTRVIKVL